ncbi:MAG: hypothetical protein JJU12_05290 [Chlamydiales bacterium]|nr:hypothetical protein [Chlamydiales bacterium]
MRIFNRTLFLFSISLLVGFSLFPDKVLLACVKSQVVRYCRKAFGAEFECEALVWKDSRIVFKKGRLVKEGEMRAEFAQATLAPFLNVKERELGGILEVEGVRIVNRKTKPENLPSPGSPTLLFLTLNLKTVIRGGEVFLYDYLAHSPFFQRVSFDLDHHVYGDQTFGSVAIDWAENERKLTTHFWRIDDEDVHLNTDLRSHSLPALYNLMAFFFHPYLPQSITHWNFDSGKLNGKLDCTLHNGVPRYLKGEIGALELHAENTPLELIGEIDEIDAILDLDFSCVKKMNGHFSLKGGRLALDKTPEFWQGLWDLRNLHTSISIKDGEIESSVLRGNFMGMDGELSLDWQSPDTLMRMGFQGYSNEISTLFPGIYRSNFRDAFAEDHFTVKANVSRSGEGLELEGTLKIKGEKEYQLSFGCLFGKGKDEVEIPLDSFFDHVADQFCLSKKRFGWFSGKQFPLEKFLSPFLLANVRMEASGLADFQGTFDERYLVISYEGEDFRLESPYFSLCTDCIEDERGAEVVAIHYLDLQTWNHVGFLPLRNTAYSQKNRDLIFEKGRGMVHFENKLIHIQDVEAYWNNLQLKGSLEIEAATLDDVDLKIWADSIIGPASDAQRVLSHFSDSVFWEIPFQGEVESREKAFFFHYHFYPEALLLSGHLQGNFKGYIENPHIECEGHAAYDMSDITLDISTSLSSFQGTVSKEAIKLEGEGARFYADRLEGGLCINEFAYKDWEGEGEIEWRGKEINVRNFFLREKMSKGECALSGIYNREKKEWKGFLEAFRWDFGETSSIWEPRGEIFGSGPFEWTLPQGGKAQLATSFHNLQFGGIHFGDGEDLNCTYNSKEGVTIEGLEVEIPTEKGVEKYKLGRFFYDLNAHKLLFEGFDFSFPPTKLPWVTELAGNLFPGKVHPTIVEWVEALKQNEPLEGRVSIEVYPDNVWVYLSLKDGTYYLSGNQFSLKNFLLVYDPNEFNIWTEVFFRDNYYWVHLLTDSMTITKGKLELSEERLSPGIPAGNRTIVADWERDPEKGLDVHSLQGNFHGLQCALSSSDSLDLSDRIEMEGRMVFDAARVIPLVGKEAQTIMNRLLLQGGYVLDGRVTIPKSDLSRLSFSGTLTGSDIHFAHVGLDTISSELEYHPDHLILRELNVNDWAGRLSVGRLDLIREAGSWIASCDRLKLEEVRLSRLRSPWTRWRSRDKPFYRSFFIRSFDLSNFYGSLNNPETFTGQGTLDFTNLPKKTLFTNLLFIPTEITARIGLDLTNLIPVRGMIDYQISNGKIHFNEFKEMYSDGKRSRFYLAEGVPAYVDLKGNLNFKLKMKQYNLLMKLAELFTISVRGTCLKPTYTFTNQP